MLELFLCDQRVLATYYYLACDTFSKIEFTIFQGGRNIYSWVQLIWKLDEANGNVKSMRSENHFRAECKCLCKRCLNLLGDGQGHRRNNPTMTPIIGNFKNQSKDWKIRHPHKKSTSICSMNDIGKFKKRFFKKDKKKCAPHGNKAAMKFVLC